MVIIIIIIKTEYMKQVMHKTVAHHPLTTITDLEYIDLRSPADESFLRYRH